jgi:hypothetical protein
MDPPGFPSPSDVLDEAIFWDICDFVESSMRRLESLRGLFETDFSDDGDISDSFAFASLITPFGAIVAIRGCAKGLLHDSQLGESLASDS